MAQLTQEQVLALKSKGLTDEKIKSLAEQKGFDMPKESLLGRVFKSEKAFGQSIAGAVGGAMPSLAGGKAVEQSNALNRQVQDNLLNAIKAKREKGEDTSRLVNALKTMDKEINFYDILNTSTGGSLNKTARQIYGEAAGVATDIIGAGALPGGVGQMAKATTIGSGIIQGAKAGAIGGSIFGAASGASRAAQDDLSGGEIVGKGLRGGVTGAVAGGVIGGAIGGIAGGVASREVRKMNKTEKFALDLVSPKTTTKTAEEAMRQGRVTEPGLFKPARITASKRDVQIADAVKGVVSPNKTVLQNINAINDTVGTLDDNITGYVVKNKVPFNQAQLRTKLNAGKGDLKLVFTSDNAAEKTYDAVSDELARLVAKNDTAGLLRARKDLDSIPGIRKLLETDKLGENARKEIVLAVRRSANEYISSQLPKGNKYTETLLRESRMLEALGNITQKNTNIIGNSNVQLLLKKNPTLRYILGLTTAGAVGGLGTAAIIGQ